MTIGIKFHGITTEIGPGGLLHSLFSTISYHLEPNGWGTRYPNLMNKLYQGRLDGEDAEGALQELVDVKEKLKDYKPEQVIWDIDNPDAKLPWGSQVGPHIRNLSGYFVTNGRRDLIDVLIENVRYLKDLGGAIEIVSYESAQKQDQLRWEE